MAKEKKFDYETFVRDLHAMALNLTEQGKGTAEILFNIIHDLNGVVEKKLYFLPRCDGASKQ